MLLTILKYLGLCLAATSSIWGITHELTVKTSDNRKRLTRAGFVSIFFVVIGLALSIVSDTIGRKNAEREQYAKAAAEARKANELILALQPLTSLNFSLQFESADTSLRRKMEDGDRDIQENAESSQGGVPRVPFEAQEYKSSLIPMLNFLGQLGNPDQKNFAGDGTDVSPGSNGVVALLPLDEVPNSILSFGEIQNDVAWNNNDTSQKLSAGFSLAYGHTYPTTSKQYFIDRPSKYAIQWDLDPVTLENSVDRANKEIRLGTKLPRVLKFIILRIAEMIPFAHNNFALPGTGLWELNPNDVKREVSNISNMRLSATVNRFSDLEYHYKLANVYQKPLYNDFGEEIETGCTILEFHLD